MQRCRLQRIKCHGDCDLLQLPLVDVSLNNDDDVHPSLINGPNNKRWCLKRREWGRSQPSRPSERQLKFFNWIFELYIWNELSFNFLAICSLHYQINYNQTVCVCFCFYIFVCLLDALFISEIFFQSLVIFIRLLLLLIIIRFHINIPIPFRPPTPFANAFYVAWFARALPPTTPS